MNDFKYLHDNLCRGVNEVIPGDGLMHKLKSKKKLRIKAGFDPTAPDLHLGHTVLISKLKQFQEFGHQVVFLIGDFTAMIGDPSGRSVTRPQLTKEQIDNNARTYKNQIFKILNPDLTEIRFNSEWLGEMSASDLIRLSSSYTVARMLERDDFEKRYQNHQSISIHEFIYPIIQGYDSVALNADIEIGGTDQKFNLIMGRHMQAIYNQEPQIVLTLPLLEGLDGKNKMSKSLNNYIAINDEPDEIFGKIMSISDDLMWRYLDLISSFDLAEIRSLRESVNQGMNPRDVKILLALDQVSRFYNKDVAEKSKSHFLNKFQKRELDEDMVYTELSVGETGIQLANLLKDSNLVSSTSEALRLIKQGGVRVNGKKVDIANPVYLPEQELICQVGKRKSLRVKLLVIT
jgi:tyrosyl-tRNA synthetase